MGALFRWMVILACLWSGAWFLASLGIEAGLPSALDMARAAGVRADAAVSDIGGFPSRFDLALERLDLGHAPSGYGLDAPGATLSARAWNPADVTLRLPARFDMMTPFGLVQARGRDAAIALRALPLPRLPVTLATLTMHSADLALPVLGRVSADRVVLAARRASASDAAYHVTADLSQLAARDMLAALGNAGGGLPERIDLLRLEAEVGFDRPWDRGAVAGPRPQPKDITITLAEVRAADVRVEAAGSLQVGDDGIPTGTLTVSVRNWRDALALATETAMITPESAGTLERMLGLLSLTSGSAADIDLPLRFEQGIVLLGPAPLGPAPRLRLP